MTSKELRKLFLDYFQDREHRIVPSASLVPAGDPTLLFTNAGMVQFKDVFLGQEKRSYTRAASSQKCLRVSGKHNDFENVGKTPRHHTFFEMLGNFSFGDYFKKEAIQYGWDFLTRACGLPEDRLVASVFQEDDESYGLWRDDIGLTEDRIFRGGEKDNFWAMGDTGPRGPCSEIHFDYGEHLGCGRPGCDPNCDCDRYVEVWNLVFMTSDQDETGRMTPLKKPSVDTGMGLERLAAVVQGKTSNYETDLFFPLFDFMRLEYGCHYGKDPETDMALRVIADHARALAFLVSDGVVPANEGRGYVIRRIMRRAVRFGKLLGIQEPFLFKTASLVVDLMKEPYPELAGARTYIEEIAKKEEVRFSTTLSMAVKIFDEVCENLKEKKEKVIPGQEVFKLFDTYGLPLDFTKDMASDKGYAIDEAGYHEEMEKQRKRARDSWKGEGSETRDSALLTLDPSIKTEFLGYETTRMENCQVIWLHCPVQTDTAASAPDAEFSRLNTGDREQVMKGEHLWLILDRTPFYAESGGQVGDTGQISCEGCVIKVTGTFYAMNHVVVHEGEVVEGELSMGDYVTAAVDEAKRKATARHHTSTHLLQAALRELLGPHVKQSGSLVSSHRFRFDFTHYAALDHSQLRSLEEMINRRIMENWSVCTATEPLDDAVAGGAMALFGEKYGDTVRVVSIRETCDEAGRELSKELCGGTHVRQTGDIGLFLISSESSIAAGVRRIEAVTGEAALKQTMAVRATLDDLCGLLKAGPGEARPLMEKVITEVREKDKEISRLRLQIASKPADSGFREERAVGSIRIAAARADELDKGELRSFADDLKNRIKPGIAVAGTVKDGKSMIVVASVGDMPDAFDAGRVIQGIAGLIDGKGGGRKDMAQAGGKHPEKLNDALESALDMIESILKKGDAT